MNNLGGEPVYGLYFYMGQAAGAPRGLITQCAKSASRSSLSTFVRNLSRHQRVQATHMFVFMISCDKRDSKPYAVPVQCLPYNSLTHSKLRQLINELIKEMVARGMKVAGML